MLNNEIILNQRIGDIVTENYHAAEYLKITESISAVAEVNL